MIADREDWLIVEAKRDDGTPTMFRIREIDPQRQLTKIFVVELPYPKTELSRLPSASDYRRLAEFEEQWLRPACGTLGWELVGSKTEDGSFFLYMYGCSDPGAMIEKLSPFDGALGFYDDDDPDWQEYGTLKVLLDQAKAIPPVQPAPATEAAPAAVAAQAKPAKATRKKPAAKPTTKPARKTSAKPARKTSTKSARKTSAKSSKSTRKTSATPKAAKRKRR
jgi:hypothetical protein